MDLQKNQERAKKLSESYNKHYKLFFIIPIILLVLCLGYLYLFTQQNGDIIKKDISLTGGTSIQVTSNVSIDPLKQALNAKFKDASVRAVSNIVTGEQVAFIIETRAPQTDITSFLEDYLGFKLTSENSSVEFTGSSIGSGFYLQLILAIFFAFTFMGTVVFFIFATNKKIKWLLIILSLVSPVLFLFLKIVTINQAFIISFIVIAAIIYFSIRYSIPSLAVILSAFADIVMTLTVVNLLGMEVSTAGIVAFLMLIGYSVDTDILLTIRTIKRKEGAVNHRIWESFKTGITMTLTALVVVLVGIVLTSSFSDVLDQIFTILAIGLFFDILNTWATNASIIKWYAEKHNI
jgi:preprotein translocase subunit SecF